MKVVTSVTFWNDAVGKRMSLSYSEIDESGKIIADNKRVDRVVTNSAIIEDMDAIMNYAAEYVANEG